MFPFGYFAEMRIFVVPVSLAFLPAVLRRPFTRGGK